MTQAAPKQVVVCVPARNEADHLPALVRSLAAQRGFSQANRLRLVVVANNCTDGTAAALRLERDAPGGSPLAIDIVEVHLDTAHSHVGVARRMAMDRGAEWLEREGAPDGILLTTDADAFAPADWVATNVDALRAAELVGGRLCLGAAADPGSTAQSSLLDERIERYWAGVRALEQRIDPPPYDPDPRHGDHTAGSLGLSASLYRQVGGLPPLRCGEDNALVTRVRCAGGRVRHCPRVSIVVSPRLAGRVEGGMASEMRRRASIAAEGGAYDLPSGSYWRRRLERRVDLRRAWTAYGEGGAGALRDVGLDDADLHAIAPATCPNDIAFVERAMLLDSQQMDAPLVDLDTAIAGIDHWLHKLSQRPVAALA